MELILTVCNDIDRILFSISLPVDIDVILYHGNGPCFPVYVRSRYRG